MKQELQQIYHDLSLGRLAREAALQRIKALKESQALATTGVVMAAPIWEPRAHIAAHGQASLERYVVLCDLPRVNARELEALVGSSRCLQSSSQLSETLAHRYAEHALACFKQIKRVLESKPAGQVRVQVVIADEYEQAVFAGLNALLKTAALENPRLTAQVILVQGDIEARALAQLLSKESAASDTMVRHSRGQREVRRWQIGEHHENSPCMFNDRGVYLITGGLGGLGVLFTREILQRTEHAKIVLTGRSAPTEDRRALLDNLGAASGRIEYRALDVTDLSQVEPLIETIQNKHGRLTGILHSAGMIADDFILRKSAEQFSRVLAPKVIGTFNLDHATRTADLDWFVLFSSVASVMGNTGQADYAAANGFLDHFAIYRNQLVALGQRVGQTLSMNWPLWQEGGMRIDPASQEWMRKAGIHPMQTTTGMAALHSSLLAKQAQALVLEGETAQLHRTVVAESMQTNVSDAGAQTTFVESSAVAAGDLIDKAEEYLRKQFASLLQLPSHQIDARAELEKYGIDSILAVGLITRLESTFGPLSKTLLFEYRTVHALAQYLVQSHASALSDLFGSAASPVSIAPVLPVTQPQQVSSRRSRRRSNVPSPTHHEPIAIVGLSGRYPEASDLDAYWRNLRDGKDCIVEVPRERWDWRQFYSQDRTLAGRHYSKWGGFIAGVDEFDPLFFNVSPKEAKQIDPQERLFLQHAWMALEDAGYTRAGLPETGVYVGVMYSEYQLFGATGSLASIANRVSYTFDLHGPSMTLDTMCSSSLTAIHLACQDLRQGRTQVAIAGGVNVSVHPHKYTVLSAGQFISSDGHCQSFGEGGDGYIPGEGVGVVILKRLSDAQRDGDHIYGVIRGSALNHGGKTNGYTVPNPQAQSSAINRALTESGIDVRQIGYIEAHGTGTKLGDPIEIAALSKAFQQHSPQRLQCLIGSAKSNIGHCESAAGIAGLTKVLLQLRHRQVVASLHSSRLNPHIDFEQTPFVVNQQLRDWDAPVIDGRALPRVAGISSFGAGGSNAHMIVEEYVAPTTTAIERGGPVAIPISARTAAQLQQKARDLLAHLDAHGSEPIDLVAVAYTLQTGREAMEERLGLLVSSVEQLREKLQALVQGSTSIDDAYRGQVKNTKEAVALFGTDADLQQTLDKWLAQGKLSKLLDVWTKGVELEWHKLYAAGKPARISLPTYPFAKDRYWIDAPAAASAPVQAELHPLLHANTSDLREQRYTSVFRGDELFFAKQKILPFAVYLEMARAAVVKALPQAMEESNVLELRDLVCGAPLVFEPGIAISISLLPRGDELIDLEIYSHKGAEETIHCQGSALVGSRAIPARLDVTRLDLHESKLPADRGDYVLHPKMLEGIVSSESAVVRLGSLCVFRSCTQELMAWVRPANESGLDVDLCDPDGNVCVQLRDLDCRALTVDAPVESSTVGSVKPTGVSLTTPGELDLKVGAASRRIRLVDPASAPASTTEIHDLGDGIFLLELFDVAPDAIERLLQALERAQQISSLKVLIMRGVEGLLRGGREQHDEAVARQLYRAIVGFPVPLIAAMAEDATGAGFMAGGLCDFMICSEGGRYGSSFVPNPQEAALLDERFGKSLTGSLKYFTSPITGRDLRANGWTAPVVPAAEVDAYARKLATNLAGKSVDALRLLKTHLARHLVRHVETLTSNETHASAPSDSEAAQEIEASWKALFADAASSPEFESEGVVIPLRSKVVHAMAHGDAILTVRMEDRQAKNLFSEALIEGLYEAFAHIAATPTYKAVILTGYDNYFASGGTKETLLAIQQGTTRFTDSTVFRLPIDCEIPVIAAMQGHGIGAGWAMGMFADIVLLSAESRYRSPYMEYGFTPGAAATLIVPEKMGYDLARETLLTAREYAGSELQERGVALQVLPREQIHSQAMAFARKLVQAPRSQLISVKRDRTQRLRDLLDPTCALEVAMHELTFVGQSQTLERIENRFLQKIEPAQAALADPIDDASALATLTATLKKLLARELHMQPDDIDEGAQFVDLGLDSISGVTWVRMINETLAISIEATQVYAHPTLRQFAGYVSRESGTAQRVSAPKASPDVRARSLPVRQPTPRAAVKTLSSLRVASRARSLRPSAPPVKQSQAIAVIGMAGQFPMAPDVETFWRNIAAGRDCVTQVPSDRWNVDAFYRPGAVEPGKTNSRWMGALEDYDRFDPLFFNISPVEAEGMDPQQRLFLQACWHGIENAGYDPKSLSGSKCGVFVGCAGGDYHQLSREQRLSAQGFTGGANSILAARICYFLNLQGPCLSIDTACSSSLVAIASACDSLVSGASDLALAGGVYVMAGPEMHVKSAQAGMLSPDGRCFAFDQRANGFVPGEAVGVVMLKRLADAQRDGDIIHGVIQGWGVNQDGRTNGITAPNPESQTRLQQDVYRRFEIDPSGIQLIEAHGTGTKLGDPIEVAGLKAAFGTYTRSEGFCALGSVKSNIGHCLTAAGIASFIKLLLAIKHRQLPPTIHFEQRNEHIPLAGSPFYVNDRLQDWAVAEAQTRRAAVSSFGFSGTNAHIVVAEHTSASSARSVSVLTQDGKLVVPLSARTEDRLQTKARELLTFLREHEATIDLVELAYTLQVGREPMEERVGFLADSTQSLCTQIESYLAGEGDPSNVYRGQVKRNRDELKLLRQDDDLRATVIERCLQQRQLAKLLELWVKGLMLDWNMLYGEVKPRRIELPLYPFAKQRCWISEVDAASQGRETLTFIHPLLHRNVSLLGLQRYQSSFGADGLFLDHEVDGANVLPPLSLLEMVRAAVVDATGNDGTAVAIGGIHWHHPIPIAEATQVRVSLFAEDEGIAFEIEAIASADSDEGRVLCVEGFATTEEPPKATPFDPGAEKRELLHESFDPSTFYSDLAAGAMRVGRGLQGLKAVYRANDRLLAQIRVSATPESQAPKYVLHPCLLEGALHACVALAGDFPQPLVPVSAEAVTIWSRGNEEMFVSVRKTHEAELRFDVDLYDQAGNACARIRGLELSLLHARASGVSQAADGLAIDPSWDGFSYLSRWQEWLDPVRTLPAAHRTVLIVCRSGEIPFETTIREHYQQKGSTVVLLRLGDRTVHVAQDEWMCGVDDAEAFQAALRAHPRIDALYFLAQTQPTGEVRSIEASDEVQLLRLVKFLKQARKVDASIDTYILTTDNYSLDDRTGHDGGAGAAGLGYSLAQGSYQFLVRNLDLSEADLRSSKDRSSVLSLIKRQPPSDRGEIFKIVAGKRYRRSFVKLNWSTQQPCPIRRNGVYVILGGSGLVGQIFTRHLIRTYQANVVWLGRSAVETPSVQALLQSFEQFGDKLLYVQADALRLESMRHAVSVIKQRFGRIDGALFSAMVFGVDNSIDQISEQQFKSVLGVKTVGSRMFYEALKDEPLDFMCYFSSGQAYSFSGASKVAAYASGINYADAFVRSIRGAAAFPVGTINWGAWRAFVQAKLQNRQDIAAANMGTLDDHEGVECFERFIGALGQGGPSQVLCMRVSDEVASLMDRDPVQVVAARAPASTATTSSERIGTAAVTADGLIRSGILECVSGVLKLPAYSIETDVAFSDYGIDSILGVSFVNKLNAHLGIALNTAVIFEYSSVDRLATHISERFGEQVQKRLDSQPEQSGGAAVTRPSSNNLSVPAPRKRNGARIAARANHTEEIAIIGMAGRFPKAENVAQFWSNLIGGVDGVEELPPQYLDRRSYSARKQKGKTRCKWGGVLAERDCFDPLFFNLSPREAEAMNPHQRLVMQESWNALEDAGYNPKKLAGTRTGIYVGAEPTNYPAASFTGMSDAIIASRLAYVLNLHGPAFVVNTGCSASAVALHLACESLRNREANMILAGGVHACMDEQTLVRLDEIEMLSPSGRCFAFDQSGDGTIISEGVGMVVLKRLDDAIAAGDVIYGTIVASGVNQDGASNGITAPNGVAQEELIRGVYDRFKIDAERISYFEAHGTGTKLGDPIETNALVRAFKRYTDKQRFCAVGSAKSHIGHTAAAAGVTGLIKVLLSMRHRQLPKLINFTTLNSLIEFDASPFYINTQTCEWQSAPGLPRMAALNSFGHSGTNAHLVIKERLPAMRQRDFNSAGRFVIPLSAKTPEQLQQRVRELLDLVRSADSQIDLESMAYTLQVGRESMEERVGWVVSTVEELIGKLQRHVDGDVSDSRGLADDKLEKLLDSWLSDPQFDWEPLWPAGTTPVRMSLPGYPFARERYWIDQPSSNEPVDESTSVAADAAAAHAPSRQHPKSIEDIIDRMDDESVAVSDVVQMLKKMIV